MLAIPLIPVVLMGSLVLERAKPVSSAEVSANLDAVLAAKWKANEVAPEPQADDATFVRRAWLDLAGRVPPALKARAFLDDKATNKRETLVDALLASPEFADHWGRVWAVRLSGKRPVNAETHNGQVLEEYLRDCLIANKSYREIVKELVSGEGARDTSGPANYLLRYEAKPANLAGAVGKHFLGVTLQCAQCHDHKFAHWK